jgi:hypothetical protein
MGNPILRRSNLTVICRSRKLFAEGFRGWDGGGNQPLANQNQNQTRCTVNQKRIFNFSLFFCGRGFRVGHVPLIISPWAYLPVLVYPGRHFTDACINSLMKYVILNKKDEKSC